MVQNDVKNFLKSYKELLANKAIMDKVREADPDAFDEKAYAQMLIRIQIADSCLQILTKDEQNIVMLHLVEQLKWSDIAAQNCRQTETGIHYSERTCKRLQSSAVRKIGDFIRESQWEDYVK